MRYCMYNEYRMSWKCSIIFVSLGGGNLFYYNSPHAVWNKNKLSKKTFYFVDTLFFKVLSGYNRGRTYRDTINVLSSFLLFTER